MSKGLRYCLGLGVLVAVLFVLNLVMGSIRIPAAEVFNILLGHESEKASWQYIVLESRLPQAITAMLCGGALAVSGLMLQTAFRNPLAGPSIFGINSGAGLGVALVMLLLLCRLRQYLRFCGHSRSGLHRCDGGNGHYILLLDNCTSSCHVAHHWYYDRLYRQFRHLTTELLRY